jgi:hypothetical protein
LIPFLVLLAGVGQTVIFAEVGGISKLRPELQNWPELAELAELVAPTLSKPRGGWLRVGLGV